MKFNKYLVCLVFLVLFLNSCQEKKLNPNHNLTLSDYEQLDTAIYRIDSHQIRETIHRLIRNDKDSLAVDNRTKRYYANSGKFLWIARWGIDEKVDTFLTYLEKVGTFGFNTEKFRLSQIKSDLNRIRTLDVNAEENSINKVFARLEYNLTKAYLRYTTGQRFGYMNPDYVFNRLDIREKDSLNVSYRGLFDLDIDKPTKNFYHLALRKVSNDSVSEFLKEIQPTHSLYMKLMDEYNNGEHSFSERIKLLCNIERSRWRVSDTPEQHSKYVLVNIPSFHLDAIDGDSVLTMRMVCGTLETKRPILTSRIKRMDINPQWVVPRSIIKRDILKHVGDREYFARKRFFVRNRATGKRVDMDDVTYEMLNNGNYAVVQEGGEGNSLGRIVFRFDNNFSVFIHDTSSREAFNSNDRGVSHGCIRAEKPYELALFMLNDKDEILAEKIKYSMSVNLNQQEEGAEKEELDKSKYIRSLNIKPEIPLFITYYTIYPDIKGKLQSYQDIYGYDAVIYKYLRNYIE